MDEIVTFFPEPTAHGPMHTADGDGGPVLRRRATSRRSSSRRCPTPTSAVVNFVKVVSGTLKPNTELVNSRTGKKERVAHVFKMTGKETADVDGASRRRHRRAPQARPTRSPTTRSSAKGDVAFAPAAAARAALPGRHRRQDQGRRGQARHGAQEHRRRGADAHAPARRGDAPDGALRRSATPRSTSCSRACTSASTSRPRLDRPAHPLPRDDPQDRAGRRAATRSRPAARASSRDCVAAPRAQPRRRLRVQRRDRRRQDPQAVHRRHRQGRPGHDDRGRARRLPGAST